MPSSLAGFAVKKGRLITVSEDYENEPMPISALRRENHRAPNRVLRLLDFIVSELQSRKEDISEFV